MHCATDMLVEGVQLAVPLLDGPSPAAHAHHDLKQLQVRTHERLDLDFLVQSSNAIVSNQDDISGVHSRPLSVHSQPACR